MSIEPRAPSKLIAVDSDDAWRVLGTSDSPTGLQCQDRTITLDPSRTQILWRGGRGIPIDKRTQTTSTKVIEQQLGFDIPDGADPEVLCLLADLLTDSVPPFTLADLRARKSTFVSSVFNPWVLALAKVGDVRVCMPIPDHVQQLVESYLHSSGAPLVFNNKARNTKVLQLSDENLFLTAEVLLAPVGGKKAEGRPRFPFHCQVDSCWSLMHAPTMWFISNVDREGAIDPSDIPKLSTLGAVNAFVISGRMPRSKVSAAIRNLSALYQSRNLPCGPEQFGVFVGSRYHQPRRADGMISRFSGEVSECYLHSPAAAALAVTVKNFTRVILRTAGGWCPNRELIAATLRRFRDELDFLVELHIPTPPGVGEAFPPTICNVVSKRDLTDGLFDKVQVGDMVDKIVADCTSKDLVGRTIGITECFGTGCVFQVSDWVDTKYRIFPRILYKQALDDLTEMRDKPLTDGDKRDAAGMVAFLSSQLLTGTTASLDDLYDWFRYERAFARTKLLLKHDPTGPVVKANSLSPTGVKKDVLSSQIPAGRRMLTCVPFSKIEGNISFLFFIAVEDVPAISPACRATACVINDLTGSRLN